MSSAVQTLPTPFHSSVSSAPATRRWSPLAVIVAAHLMAILDITVMFVALPSAQHALGMSVSARQWVLSAYTLAFAALLLIGGRLADRFGARRTLLAGVIGFAAASAVGGSSVDGVMLIAARAVQGAFGAILVSSTKSLLISVYADERERARAIGIFAATLTAGMAFGLVLGGLLSSGLGWRWCLYINVPVCLLVVPGTIRVLPSLAPRRSVRFDTTSAALCSVGMLALVYGLGEVPAAGWDSGRVIGSLILATAALAAFIARQAGKPSALLPLRIVCERNRGGALIAMVFNSLSTVGMMLILTYQLQLVMRYSPLSSGLALIPFALAAALGSVVIARRLMPSVEPRWLITAGILLSAGGLLPLLGLTARSHYLPLILIAELIEGLGTGLGGPAILATALRAIPQGDAGAASAASSTAGQLGSSIGAALLNTIAATATAAYLAAHASASPAEGIAHGYTVAAAWGAGILLAIAVPICVLINAKAPPPHREARGA
jgi:EmrB/QacA subfamily drug resistance transporter